MLLFFVTDQFNLFAVVPRTRPPSHRFKSRHACFKRIDEPWLFGVMLGQLIQQYNIEKRLVYPDATVVFDESELAKAIHEKADA
jgi:hypothetical protein